MMKKRFFSVGMVLVLIVAIFPTTMVHASNIRVIVDGQVVIFPDQNPVTVGGRTLVPASGVFEALGFETDWDGATSTAILTRHDFQLRITIGSYVFTTNGVPHTLDVPAQVIGGRTMIPLRFPLESIGLEPEWDGATSTITISSGGWRSSASYANAPYFYGATKITVPIGTPVDLRSGMFRLMAHDVFDGDITHKMTMFPATVDTSNAGVTAINYSVTNSRGTTTTKTVYVTVEARNNLVVERVVHSMPAADTRATEISGQSRGNRQCSQHLGIYMPPNSNFQIRMLDGFHSLEVWSYTAIAPVAERTQLLRDGTAVNISHGSGVSGHGRVEPNMGRIPLIKTPRSDEGHFTVEVTLSLMGLGSVRGLDYFHYGDTNEAEFLANWTPDRELAVIASNAVVIIVPWGDRAQLTGTTHRAAQYSPRVAVHSINELLSFYNETVHYFQKWNGYYLSAQVPHNRLIHARFLVIPAFGGAGYAFAATHHLGFSVLSPSYEISVYPYLFRDWVVFHEMGHMFDGVLAWNRELPLVEIVTNVPAHFMQRRFTNPERLWINHNGNLTREQMERVYLAMNSGSFPEGFHGPLFALIFLLESSGDEYVAWARIQTLNRETMTRGESWSVADLFTQAIFEMSGINMVAHLEQVGLFPSDTIRANVSGGTTPLLQMPTPIIDVPLEERTPVLRPSDTPVSERVFTIRNQAGRYLAIVNGALSCSAVSTGNTWFLRRAENGGYFIYANEPTRNRRLDLVNNWDIEDHRIQIWGGGHAINPQTWFLISNGDGTYQIRTVNESQRVLTANMGSYPTIQTFLWLDTQRWVFEQQPMR